MVQLKAGSIDRYIRSPDDGHRLMLIYGPDSGLVSERATLLAKGSGVDLADPFSTIRIDAEEAAADPARVSDEARTIPMFGGERLIWIRGSTQKNLMKALQPILDEPPGDARIIVEAGNLKKSSPLRKAVEASKSAVALPCYADQSRAIDDVIDEELQKESLTIEPHARALLKSLLGGDRLASRGEIQKLCLYAKDKQAIDSEDIISIVGDASSVDIDRLIDAACTGDVSAMETHFKRLVGRGTAVFQIVSGLQRHFHMLHRARMTMIGKQQPAAQAVSALRPPINFQRRDAVARALQIWQPVPLERSLARLDRVALESRAKAGLAVPLVSTALLAIAIEARRAGAP